MHGNCQLRNSVLFTLALSAAITLIVLLTAVPAGAQSPVPPTAREASSSPAFAAKLHPTRTPAMNKPSAACATSASTRRSCGPSPQDGIIYENGPVNGTTDAWTINYGYVVSDTFVPGSITVSGFDLGVWEFPGDTLTSVDWSVTTQPNGGTVLGSGTVSGSSLKDAFISTNQYGYNIDKISATGLNVTVTVNNTYWVNLQNASVPSGDPVYWDENSGASCTSPGCPSQAYDSAVGTIASEAFDLTGNGCEPPPPPTCYGSGGKFQIIHDFAQQEGATDSGVTIDKAGNLYGTTPAGGMNGQGLVYELSPKVQGWVFSPLYSFLGGSSGFGPVATILGPDSALYGTAGGGMQNCENNGGNYCGLVYSLRPAPTACLTALCSWIESVLYEPAGRSDESWPGSSFVFDKAGNLYGTSWSGGAYGGGAVYELTPSNGGWTERVLYSFMGGSDGLGPSSLLVGNDGNLYGTTISGGDLNCNSGYGGGCGTVFQLSPSGSGWTKTVLHTFENTRDDGDGPGNLVQDGAGNLYGTSCFRAGGGCADGSIVFAIVFMLSPSDGGWVFTQIWQQRQDTGVGGREGINNLTIDGAGNLYGTAGFDLIYCSGYGHNAYIFELMPVGSGWQFIYLAPLGSSYFNSEGPLALDAQGGLYGTSDSCGKYGHGTVWKVSP